MFSLIVTLSLISLQTPYPFAQDTFTVFTPSSTPYQLHKGHHHYVGCASTSSICLNQEWLLVLIKCGWVCMLWSFISYKQNLDNFEALSSWKGLLESWSKCNWLKNTPRKWKKSHLKTLKSTIFCSENQALQYKAVTLRLSLSIAQWVSELDLLNCCLLTYIFQQHYFFAVIFH